MKNKKQNHEHGFILKTLAVSVMLLSGSAHALQAMDDSDLRSVNGQDGVSISTTFDEVNFDKLYWTDQVGRGTSGTNLKQELTALAENIKISKSNVASVTPGADLKLNTGSEVGKTGVDLKLAINPMLLTVDKFRICNSDDGGCSPEIGNLAIQTTSDLNFELKTRDGLFSSTSQSDLVLGLKNANVYLGQMDSSNKLNQLILKNMNFNFIGKGFMFVDSKNGFIMKTNNGTAADLTTKPGDNYGYVDFTRVADSASGKTGFINTGTYGASGITTGSGLNLEIMLNSNVDKTSPYTLDTLTNTPTNAKGLIRVGASGRMVNGQLQIRGLTTAGGTDLLGKATSATGGATNNNVMGDSGIAFRMKADFTKEGDSMLGTDGKATTLEIGGAGLNAYGFEFGNLTGLQPNERGTFDSGNIYLNLVDTKTVLLPENYTFQNSRFGNNSFLTVTDDYKQNLHNMTSNPYAVMMSIRGGEFQALSRRGRFTTSAGISDSANLITNNNNGLDNQWGLALPFYNLNANMAMYGAKIPGMAAYYFTSDDKGVITKNSVGTVDTARLGFSLAMSTQGIDRDTNNVKLGNKTTSILVIDGGKYLDNKGISKTTDYYMGLRNIDMLLKGDGSIGIENGSVNIGLKNMLIVMAAEVAAGYLPGTTYKSCATSVAAASAACGNQSISPKNSFALKDDVLLGLKLRLGGDIDLSLIPNSSIANGSKMSIVGELNLANSGNTIQISDPIDGSTIGLDNLTGRIAFDNAIVIGKDQTTGNPTSGNGKIGFNSTFNFNPGQVAADVFRAKDLKFYPPNTGVGARMGEVAITGGRLSTAFSITPR